MRLGLFQSTSPKGDIAEGLATVEQALSEAAAVDLGMLVMPELFLPGYGHAVDHGSGTDQQEAVADLCRRHGVALTIGLEEHQGPKRFNTAYSFGADGTVLAKYRKIQLFGPGEAAAFTPGDAFTVFDYQGVRFGLLICYDVEFPEHVRALTQLGAKVVLVPTANMMPFVNVNQILVPARACENAITIVYANYCGSEGALDYTGCSVIAGPDGYPLALKGTGPGLTIADLPGDWSERGIPDATQQDDYRPVEQKT